MAVERLCAEKALLLIRKQQTKHQLESELEALEKDLEQEKLQRDVTKNMLDESVRKVTHLRMQIEEKRNEISYTMSDFDREIDIADYECSAGCSNC